MFLSSFVPFNLRICIKQSLDVANINSEFDINVKLNLIPFNKHFMICNLRSTANYNVNFELHLENVNFQKVFYKLLDCRKLHQFGYANPILKDEILR